MSRHRQRTMLATSCFAHFLHDGCSDLLYLLFPIWAREFSLSFAQVGLLGAGYSGALALGQIPAGFLAERWGEPRILAAGTLLTAAGFLCLGTALGFASLLFFLVIGGLGSGTQHPLASSMVSSAYKDGPRRAVLGIYNFFGDLGKMIWPACVAFLTTWASWRWAVKGMGLAVFLTAAAIFFLFSSREPEGAEVQASLLARLTGDRWGIRDMQGFSLLSVIYSIDLGSRTVFLTYLPFLLLGKGADMKLIALALGLTFAGGAAGKFVCGILAEHLGIIRTVLVTETMTGLGMAFLLVLPLTPALFFLPVLGVALNGTSSVLYGTVAELVEPERLARVYGVFYTIGIGAGALAPPLFGLLSDMAGVKAALALLAALVLLTLPLAQRLRQSVEFQQSYNS